MKMLSKNFFQAIVLVLQLLSFWQVNSQEALLEKIYTHTDRTFYLPGETLWYKGYITNPQIKYSDLSKVMYVDLISPKGDIIDNSLHKIEDGYFQGNFDIRTSWVGGIYTLKCYTVWSKNYGKVAFFTKKITVQKVVQPRLLMKLDFEKKAYGSKSKVEANFEVKDLKNNPLKYKEIAYTVSVKGKLFLKNKFITNTDGKKKVTFLLPDELNTQDVLLNVLIPHKGSTESISRSVPIVLNNVDLQFLPESGVLLENVLNKVAFKAVNEYGKPADISGIILDSQGKEVSKFESFHDGMGSFNFIPKPNEAYTALITKPFTSNKPTLLPSASKEGTILSLIETNSEITKLRIVSSNQSKVLLKLNDVGENIFSKEIKLSQKSTFFEKEFSINTKKFALGITSFTVFDLNKKPLCERLVFLNKQRDLKVNIELEKEVFNIREKVKVKIKTTDSENCPIPSNLSISVADNKLISLADDKQDHILSSLLVSSELKGTIHEPIFYFDKTKEKANKALDHIMLTHGWRTYIKKPLTSEEGVKYESDRTPIIRGTVVDKDNKPITAKLILFDNNHNEEVLVFKTNSDGTFSFRSPEGRYDRFTLLAFRKDNKEVNIIDNVILEKDEYGYTKSILINGKSAVDNRNQIIKNLNEVFNQKSAIKQKVIEGEEMSEDVETEKKATSSLSLEEDSKALEETVVIGYGTTTKRALTGSVVSVRAEEIEKVQAINFEQALVAKAPGVRVVSSEGGPGSGLKIQVRGNTSFLTNSDPLYVIDGFPVVHGESNCLGSASALASIDPASVNSIEVLKDAASTATYGSRGANGVVLITTKKFHGRRNLLYRRKSKFNYTVKNYTGFQKYNSLTYVKDFYKPIYDKNIVPEVRTDFRQTIYWNPVVQTDENGEAEIEFYNSDAITSFKINTEGISANGLVGRNEAFYGAKKILNVDFKLPNYLSKNDEVILPVTITNELDRDLKGVLSLNLPIGFEVKEGLKDSISVPHNSFILKNLHLKPTKRIRKSFIEASFITQEYKDKKRLTTEVLSTQFPIYSSISDFKNNSFSFNLENTIPGTIESNLSVNVNVLSDLTDGIESMIKEPWGCFEQVSSVTYPNILVLQYLKAINKTNRRIERNAMKYIEDGYKKIAGYKVAGQGFSWFGRNPASETLTAYGLMELYDMKKVITGVNEDLFQSTLNWLLSRKNGLGGFKQYRGEYGYSSTPDIVGNAYIIYALSEIYNKNFDISKEFEVAYKEALESKDTYRMCLMTLACNNFGYTNKANKLYSLIFQSIKKYGIEELPTEYTVTRSYHRAKKVETASLLLLALLENNEVELNLLKRTSNFILSKKYYGGFGNTQATTQALKALLKFSELHPTKVNYENEEIRVIINNDTITQKFSERRHNKIYVDSIEKYLITGKQKIKVEFSNPEITFPYTIDSSWKSTIPDSDPDCPVSLSTIIDTTKPYKVGDNIRMQITVKNRKQNGVPMTTAIIGIPSGTSPQPWQLKEILETNKVAYYETFQNYLVLYWTELGGQKEKLINLDLKANIAGNYTAPPSSVYLYYGSNQKNWIKGNSINILP